jgi:MoaA/NifB/PqqE/SkfB family radical SAM enzyme
MNALSPAQAAGLFRLGRRLLTNMVNRPSLPYKVEFLITGRCDSRCRTCGIWTRQTSQGEDPDADDIIKAAGSLGKDLLWLGLSGGEPTLRADFPDIAAGIRDVCPRLVLLNFGSNGLDPDRVFERAERLAAVPIPFIVCALSIDGVGEQHDRVRGVPGAFERLVESAERLIGLEKRFPRFSVSFQTTVSSLNHDHVHEIPKFLSSRFPHHVYIATMATDSYLVGRDAREKLVWDARLSSAVSQLMKSAPITSPFDLIPQAYLGLAPDFVANGRSPIACRAGRDMVMIDPHSRLRPCDYAPDAIGSLTAFDYDLRRMLLDPAIRAKLDAYADCRDCFTPCQAYPSLLHQPGALFRGLLRNRR